MRGERVGARGGLGVCAVVSICDVTPKMRRVTFTGAGLRGLVATGPDQRVKVSFPSAARFGDDPAQLAAARRRRRTYTLLAVDPVAGTAVIDFVLHDGGVASTWAQHAAAGDEVLLSAPVGGYVLPDDASELVMVADETGLPAAQAIAANLPPGLPARAYLEIADSAQRQPIPSPATLRVTWLERAGAEHGQPMSALAQEWTDPAGADSVRADAAVWIAGESAAVRCLRTALVAQVGLDRHRVDATAYWTAT